MTDFGRRGGDMLKLIYDPSDIGIVWNSMLLDLLTPAQVRDHIPKSHTHTELEISDLIHNAAKILGVVVDDTDKGDAKGLYYNASTQKLEYETPPTGGANYVDRGDPVAPDWTVSHFTTNGQWLDLDCSSIVPAGAIAITFQVNIQTTLSGNFFLLRKNGNTNIYNRYFINTQYANRNIAGQGTAFCDINRVVEYRASNTTFAVIDLTVMGWFI